MPHRKPEHLYVMQNQFGLVKIGKSVDVELRRRRLSKADNCEITLVHIGEDKGEQERTYLTLLAKYQVYGEWFEGTALSREAIASVCSIPSETIWPFELKDQREIETWIDELDRSRTRESRLKLSQRLIRNMEKDAYLPTEERWHFHYNFKIWQFIWEYVEGLNPQVWTESDGNRESVSVATHDYNSEVYKLPNFTSDLTAAMTIWPAKSRPTHWHSDDAWLCCIQGLKARRAMFLADSD